MAHFRHCSHSTHPSLLDENVWESLNDGMFEDLATEPGPQKSSYAVQDLDPRELLGILCIPTKSP